MENMHCPSVYIKLIHDWLEKETNQQLKGMDLTFVQGRIMVWLRARGGRATQKEVEAYLEVAHPTVVGILQRLQAKGLIACELDCNDRRVKVVRLTETEEGFYRQVTQYQKGIEEKMLWALDESQREELNELLQRVYESIGRETAADEEMHLK